MSERYVAVLHIGDLPENSMRGVTVGQRPLTICRMPDGIFAVDGVCTHAHALLHEGRLRGNRLICPLHGASFDVRSGKVLGGPATQELRCYAVRVSGDMIEAKVPDAP
jgi:nitrite reductase/ring-hydroxylating ferredoxin subunit